MSLMNVRQCTDFFRTKLSTNSLPPGLFTQLFFFYLIIQTSFINQYIYIYIYIIQNKLIWLIKIKFLKNEFGNIIVFDFNEIKN